MEALNNTTEAVGMRQVVQGHSVFTELILTARYSIAAVAIIINAGIVIAFLVQKLRRPIAVQVSPIGLLVINLLLVDTFLGIVIVLNVATASTIMTADSKWCGARLSISYLATIGSHVALLNVIIDRYVAVVHTLKYREWMTWRRSVAMVCCGWIVPVAGAAAVAVVASDDRYSGVARSTEICASKAFLRYVWIPTHFSANLCVIAIQCQVYLSLKRHDAKKASSNQVHNSSDKSLWLLFRITTPTYIAMLIVDVMRVIIMTRINEIILNIYQVTLLFVQIAFLMNPLMYSYATANIRKPVSDLYNDIKKWLRPAKAVTEPTSPSDPLKHVSVFLVGKSPCS